MAADSAVMVIDAAKGIEPQTRKLFKVCAMRDIPIFTFINKLDREARDPFDLLDELEKEFGIGTYPVNWPIGCGKSFKGVFDRQKRSIEAFSEFHRGRERVRAVECDITDTEKMDSLIGEYSRAALVEQVELLDVASYEFDLDAVRHGKLSPVFFGSALNNFGIEPFLESFLKMTTPPLPHRSGESEIDPFDERFSAFVFKIQANMNRAHRDRIAFFRICSGKFSRGKEYYHVQGGKTLKLSQPQQMMAQEREIIDEAYAGDIIGVFDPGIFSIGDTVCSPGMGVQYAGIPTFAPEHFAIVEQIDSMKRKQFAKGMAQIAQEGAIQIFLDPGMGMERVIVGVVGVLQFDVLEFRMESEYGVKYRKSDLPHQLIRYVVGEVDPSTLKLMQATRWVQDINGRNLLIFTADYEIRWALEKNPGLELAEFSSM
jgi:peptide chain release factor 3